MQTCYLRMLPRLPTNTLHVGKAMESKCVPPVMEAASSETLPASTAGARVLFARTDRDCKFFYQHTNHRYNNDTGSNHRRNGAAHQY